MVTLFDTRTMLVIFIICALLIATPALIPTLTAIAHPDRPVAPQNGGWILQHVGTGWDDTGTTESRYPKDDCGGNHWLSFILGGFQDACVRQVFPTRCVEYYTAVYTAKAYSELTAEEEAQITLVEAQGAKWAGFVGIQDQVLHDLSIGKILCP